MPPRKTVLAKNFGVANNILFRGASGIAQSGNFTFTQSTSTQQITGANTFPTLRFVNAPTTGATLSGTPLYNIVGRGYTSTGTLATQDNSVFRSMAAENQTTTAQGSYLEGYVTPIGSIALTKAFQFNNDGSATFNNVFPASNNTYALGSGSFNYTAVNARSIVSTGGALMLSTGSLNGIVLNINNAEVARYSSATNNYIVGTTTDNGTDRGQFNGSVISGIPGTTIGIFKLAGNTSGTVSIRPQAAAGTYNFNLPTTAGTDGQYLTSKAGGSIAMTWTTPTAVNRSHTIFTPTTGGTVSTVVNQVNIINPAGTLVSLTVNLPSSPANNDIVYIKFTQAVTTVTYGNGTVADGITSPVAGGLLILTYDTASTTWY